MGVRVDEGWRDDHPGGGDRAVGDDMRGHRIADEADLVRRHANIEPPGRRAGAVDHGPVRNEKVDARPLVP